MHVQGEVSGARGLIVEEGDDLCFVCVYMCVYVYIYMIYI